MSLILEIRCDTCDRAGDSGTWKLVKAHTLRANLKRAGWYICSGGDFCGNCWPVERKAKKR